MRKNLPPVVQPFLFTFEIASSDVGGSVYSSTNTNSSRVSPELSCSPQSDKPDSPIPQERPTSEIQLVPFREESPILRQPQPTMIPIFSLLPSLRFLSIPRQLHIQLQSSGPEHFQVSDTTSSELDLSLCAFPLFSCNIQTSRGLTLFDQLPRGATTIATVWDLSHRSQARCCNAWRYFKHLCSPVFYLHHGWAWGPFSCWRRTPTHNGPTACKIWSIGFGTTCRNQ